MKKILYSLLDMHLFGATVMFTFFVSTLTKYSELVVPMSTTLLYVGISFFLLLLAFYRYYAISENKTNQNILVFIVQILTEFIFLDTYFLLLDMLGNLTYVFMALIFVEFAIIIFTSKGLSGPRYEAKNRDSKFSLFHSFLLLYPLFFSYLSYSSLDKTIIVNGFYIPLSVIGIGCALASYIFYQIKKPLIASYFWRTTFSLVVIVFVFGLFSGIVRYIFVAYLLITYILFLVRERKEYNV